MKFVERTHNHDGGLHDGRCCCGRLWEREEMKKRENQEAGGPQKTKTAGVLVMEEQRRGKLMEKGFGGAAWDGFVGARAHNLHARTHTHKRARCKAVVPALVVSRPSFCSADCAVAA